MKKLLFFAIFFLIIPVSAGQDWLENEEYVIGLNISSGFNLIPSKTNYKIDYVSTKLSFFPEDRPLQQVLNINTKPAAERVNRHYEFKWKNPEKKDYNFSLNAEIKTKNNGHKIKTRIYFPVSAAEEYLKYTEPSEHIDSNNTFISAQASSIAEGKDDLYEVVYELAKWINENIEYDITCGDRIEKASWVLKNKRGTCDEFTSLFIAMCRSLEVPARYLAGIAYSNIQEIEGFNSHAWAEVYFPGYGWTSFDVTYGQFGFVDASHVVLKESVDPEESSTVYEWKGIGADLQTTALQIDAFLVNKSGIAEKFISLNITPAKDKAGFGSYNLIEADVENLKHCYVATKLYLSKPTELELFERFDKTILLKPDEKKTIYWLVMVSNNLNKKAVYTFPVKVTSLRGVIAEAEFSSSKSDKKYSKAEIEKETEEDKKSSEIINPVDTPEIKISELEYPSEVNYNKNFSIWFVLNKKSKANPQNVAIHLNQDNYEKIWEIDELSEDGSFMANLKPDDLNKDINNFKLLVNFEDTAGKHYSIEKNFTITLAKQSFWHKIKIWFSDLTGAIKSLFL